MPSVKIPYTASVIIGMVAIFVIFILGGILEYLRPLRPESARVQQVVTDQNLVVRPSATVRLPPGQKLVQYELTYKSTNHGIPDPGLSYLTRDMRPGEAPETYKLVRLQNYPIRNQLYPPPAVKDVIIIEEQAPIRAESTTPDPTRK